MLLRLFPWYNRVYIQLQPLIDRLQGAVWWSATEKTAIILATVSTPNPDLEVSHMILADKIIALRRRRGWSQEELADRIGVSRQAVSKWESSQSIPDIEKIEYNFYKKTLANWFQV